MFKLYDTGQTHITELENYSKHDKCVLIPGSQSAHVLVALGNVLNEFDISISIILTFWC